MRLIYSSAKLKEQCKSYESARRFFNGDDVLARKLLDRINLLENAETLKDVLAYKPCHLHPLGNKNGKNLIGYYAIDVKTRKEPWRVIFQPLNEKEEPYDSCNIDEIASIVQIVNITEVSKHYE